MYPVFADQPAVADGVGVMGAGVRVSPRLSAGDLRQAVHPVLTDPRYASNAARIGACWRAAGGCRQGAEAVAELKRVAAIG